MPLFDKLKPAHMSGDETDGEQKVHPPVFRQIDAAYMSKELQALFHRLDDIYRDDWANPGGGIRATSGNPPRTRLPSRGNFVNSIAPKGLAKNCYDPTWLKKLKRHQIVNLQVLNKEWDLTIPEDFDSQ